MHPLKVWLREHRLSLGEFAERVNAHGARTRVGTKLKPIYVSQLLQGVRRPTYDVAAIIQAVTGCAVTVAALMEYERPATDEPKTAA